ncbi:transglycosylase SLT domain-containing protein [Nonomuraea sp. LP-02]|uniref:transglycosylase SLT domain-containing protein n=1 Tax=Nonomuraea sp. LP-02 TaxID=3097960 RepID=UPI002E382464|nr:WXG100 family type VII secretion target [Nonomuraea sp. LP-02]MED7927446.1 transglycosylase SLT domain-containing protein [Nonomuraea sp. LP-02]
MSVVSQLAALLEKVNGDPEAIKDLAAALRVAGSHATTSTNALSRYVTEVGAAWKGDSATAFTEYMDAYPKAGSDLREALSSCATALNAVAGKIEDAHTTVNTLHVNAVAAENDYKGKHKNAKQEDIDAHVKSTLGGDPVARAKKAVGDAEDALTTAKDELGKQLGSKNFGFFKGIRQPGGLDFLPGEHEPDWQKRSGYNPTKPSSTQPVVSPVSNPTNTGPAADPNGNPTGNPTGNQNATDPNANATTDPNTTGPNTTDPNTTSNAGTTDPNATDPDTTSNPGTTEPEINAPGVVEPSAGATDPSTTADPAADAPGTNASADTGAGETASDARILPGYGDMPAPKQEVVDWIKEALTVIESPEMADILRERGLDISDLSAADPVDLTRIWAIIYHESGGDPTAIGDWGGGAQSDVAPQGLMQTIPATFEAHHLPGHDKIQDPVDNIIAGVLSIYSKYGNLADHPGIASLESQGGYQSS